MAGKPPWTDQQTEFLVMCAKENIPFDWVDRALGKPVSSAHSRSRVIEIKPSVWKGRIPYKAVKRMRPEMSNIVIKFRKEGLNLEWVI